MTKNSEKTNRKAKTSHSNHKKRCFFCKYELKTKFRSINYKNTTVKVCMSCNTKKNKACSPNYNDAYVDCSICEKAVIYDSSIYCSCCNHFIHQKCTKLSKEDILDIENSNSTWTCNKCCEDIFPFFQLDSTKMNKLFNHKLPFPSTRSVASPISKSQCFLCTNIVPNRKYKNKGIIYDNKRVKLCEPCGHDQSKTKNKHLIEYLDCTICNKEVKYESIFCSICQHWLHPECSDLNRKDLIKMGENYYGDWFCPPCSSSIFPFSMPIETKSTHEVNIEFQTYLDCSSCSKPVKGESMCCGICQHWVHNKYIGNFSSKRIIKNKNSIIVDSFENMNDFYKDRDWFCYECSRSIFPCFSLSDEDFLIEFDSKNATSNSNI